MKSVLVDQSVQRRLAERVAAKCKYETGLLVGQWDEEKAYVLESVPTPGLGDDSKWSKESAEWIVRHAQLISRMTCGGLHVIGDSPS